MSSVANRMQVRPGVSQASEPVADVVLLTATLLVLAIGILFVYSTSSITAEKNFGSAHFY